jgi:hypothetical protein
LKYLKECEVSKALGDQIHLITNGGGGQEVFLLPRYHPKAKNAATERIVFIDWLRSFLKL